MFHVHVTKILQTKCPLHLHWNFIKIGGLHKRAIDLWVALQYPKKSYSELREIVLNKAVVKRLTEPKPTV